MSVRLGSPRIWRIALGAVALLSFAVAIPLSLLSHQAANGVIAAVIGVPCAAVGMVVTRRQRENPLGWLFLGIGVCLFLSTDGGDYGYYVYRLGHHLPLGAAGSALATLSVVCLALGGPSVRRATARRSWAWYPAWRGSVWPRCRCLSGWRS